MPVTCTSRQTEVGKALHEHFSQQHAAKKAQVEEKIGAYIAEVKLQAQVRTSFVMAALGGDAGISTRASFQAAAKPEAKGRSCVGAGI